MRKVAFLALIALAGCTGGDDDDDAFSGDTLVSGDVFTITPGGVDTAVSGATIEAVPGGPSTTSAADGTWSLLLASNSTPTLRATATGNWGSQVVLPIPAGGTTLDFGLPSDTLVDALGSALGLGAPDTTKGIVAVDFFGAVSTSGGFAVTISAANAGSFTFDSAGNPVLSASTLPNGDTQLIFVNVDTGTATLTVTSSGTATCTNAFVASHPVDAKIVTLAPVFCQ